MGNSIRNAPAKARNPRPVVTGRGLECLLGSEQHNDTTETLRLQRLRLLGIIGQRASLLAQMAWEVQHG